MNELISRSRKGLLYLCLLVIGISSCKESDEVSTSPYDPNVPVTVTGFTPEGGTAKTQLIVYGSNFGCDPSIVKVKVGDKDAKIINVKGDCLYCFVPEKSGGKIEVQVGDSEPVVSEKDFKYQFKRLVSTLCGYVDELNQGSILREGPFDKLEKIESPAWLSFDPLDNNILYCCRDNGNQANKSLLKFDLKERYMSTVYDCGTGGIVRVAGIEWDDDGLMMVSTPNKAINNSTTGCIAFERKSDGQLDFNSPKVLLKLPQSNCVMYNSDADMIYYSWYKEKKICSYDYDTNGYGNNYAFQNVLYQFSVGNLDRIFVNHPTDEYMYMVLPYQDVIYRANYDPITKSYSFPYRVCGGAGRGYEDKVGVNAKLAKPGQGVFVYNPEYKGQKDEYDFYFVDRINHCIRILSPNGVVSTFAGRGSRNLDTKYEGYVDGDLREDARFKDPNGIAYDKENDVFYISDAGNFRIRKIAYEEGYHKETETETGDADENVEQGETENNINQ